VCPLRLRLGTYIYGPDGLPTCEGTTTTPLGYDAQYTSADTGLLYMRARTYDPATAQFLTRDPWVALTGEPYSYASDNPLTWADPTGRCGVVCIGGIVLGGVALATGVGEVVGATVVIGETAVSLGAVSVVTGLAGAGADLKECIGGSNISCVGATVGGLASGGAGLVAFGAIGETAIFGVKAIGLTLGGIGGLGDAAGALASSNPGSNSTLSGCG
jgi:RHS repeat-associated protein